MLALLDEIEAGAGDNPFLGDNKAKRYRRQLRLAEKSGADALGQWRVRFELGQQELNLGNTDEAIRLLGEAYALLPRVDFGSEDSGGRKSGHGAAYWQNLTRLHLGVANMRRGEVENCCQEHTGQSCILPIQGEGVHRERRGSRDAMRYFLEILENRPPVRDPVEEFECEKTALWLLNIAAMTLGEYPDGVPEEHRVPDLLRSDLELPRFREVASEVGLDTFKLSGGAIADDFDGDAYLDVVISTFDVRDHMHFFHNSRDGRFEERTEEAGLTPFRGGLIMVQADYDNDGDTDIYVARGSWMHKYGKHPDSLLRNDGAAHFTDVTFEAGLAEPFHPNKTAAWADHDNDGDLDLFVGNESTTDVDAPCELFQNEGDGTFRDVAVAAGLDVRLFANGTSWGDYDGDRYPDFYVSTGFSNPLLVSDDGSPNRLFHNNKDGTFTDLAPELGVTEPIAGFPCWFWDYDNDGNLDIYASCSSGPVAILVSSNRRDLSRLYKGDGHGGFTQVAEKVGLGYPTQPMGANFGDLDNDGYPDFYLGTGNIQFSELRPNLMYLNVASTEGRRFADVTVSGGFGHLQKGHGVSFADLDNDNDIDVFIQMGGAWPADKFYDALFENPGFGRHSLTVKLEGRSSNRSAIGARIRLEVDEQGRERSIYRWVNSGGSFGCNPLRQTIGTGEATTVRLLEVYWPTSDTTQTFRDVPADQAIHIVEGGEGWERIPLERLKFGG